MINPVSNNVYPSPTTEKTQTTAKKVANPQNDFEGELASQDSDVSVNLEATSKNSTQEVAPKGKKTSGAKSEAGQKSTKKSEALSLGKEDGTEPKSLPTSAVGQLQIAQFQKGQPQAQLQQGQSSRDGLFHVGGGDGANHALNSNPALKGKSDLEYSSRSTPAYGSPVTQKSMASSQNGSTIAGLKPWNSDWVFEGGDNMNPKLKPIIQSPEEKALQALEDSAQKMRDSSQIKRGDSELAPEVSEAEVAALLETLKSLDGNIDGSQTRRGEGNGIQRSLTSGENPLQPNYSNGLSGSNFSGGEFLTTMAAAKPVNRQDASFEPTGSSSTPSLDGRSRLRILDGGVKGKSSSFEEQGSPQLAVGSAGAISMQRDRMETGNVVPQPVVTGHVVKGSMARDRLSHESLIGISAGIQSLSAKGGGEMRIKLNPESLGQLNLHVTTRGNTVGLKIQASDEGAKQVLEASLSHLRESMASRNLVLSRVDISTADQSSNGLSSSGRFDRGDYQGQQGHPAYQDLRDMTGNNGRRSNRWDLVDDAELAGSRGRGSVSAAMNSGLTGTQTIPSREDGRLDVMA